MMKDRRKMTNLILICALTVSLLPQPVRAAGSAGPGLPAEPIGTVESFGLIKINGQSMQGKGLLWGGEVLQSPTEIGGRVTLPSIGEVILSGKTVVKMSAVGGDSAALSRRKVLMISLMSGDLAIRLEPLAVGHLEAGGSYFTASAGAALRLGIRGGRAVLIPLNGTVVDMGNWAVSLPRTIELAAMRARRVQEQTAQHKYLIRWTEAVADVRARSTRQVQVRVTDENDRPVPDAIIVFGAGGAVGSFSSSTASTNANGIASVNFTAGNQTATGSLTATVQGTTFTATMPVYVVKVVPGFWTVQNAVPVFATAATAVTIGTIKVVTREEKFKVRTRDVPRIIP